MSTGNDHAQILRELGELARDRNDRQTAIMHYEQAIALLRVSADELKLAHSIRHLGDIYAEAQNWTEADHCLSEAMGIYRGHPSPHPLDLANAIRSYAVVKAEISPREEARALWVEAGELYDAAGIAAGVEECRRRALEAPR
jgi:tetratricopeptide (TPR) repeat protein